MGIRFTGFGRPPRLTLENDQALLRFGWDSQREHECGFENSFLSSISGLTEAELAERGRAGARAPLPGRDGQLGAMNWPLKGGTWHDFKFVDTCRSVPRLIKDANLRVFVAREFLRETEAETLQDLKFWWEWEAPTQTKNLVEVCWNSRMFALWFRDENLAAIFEQAQKSGRAHFGLVNRVGGYSSRGLEGYVITSADFGNQQV